MIDETSLDNLAIIVEGSKSGTHGGEIMLARDLKTLIFKPVIPFELGEKVDVRFLYKVKAINGGNYSRFSFHLK